jgi:hypothetical protein
MDREHCLLILGGYGVGPKMIWLIQNFWENATMVCEASVNYSTPFQAGRGVTQGAPLSAKLFNVFVDAVAWECLRELQEGSTLPDKINHLMATFFAISTLMMSTWHHVTRTSSRGRLMSLLASLPALVLRPTYRRRRR